MGKIILRTNKQRVGFLDNAERYITSPVRYTTIAWEELVELACENSGIPMAQMVSAIYAIRQQIVQFVLNGHWLELMDLGTMYFSTKTKATVDEDDAGADAVRRICVKFRQSKKLESLLNAKVTLETTSSTTSSTSSSTGSTSGSGSSTGGSSGGSSGDSGDSGGSGIDPFGG